MWHHLTRKEPATESLKEDEFTVIRNETKDPCCGTAERLVALPSGVSAKSRKHGYVAGCSLPKGMPRKNTEAVAVGAGELLVSKGGHSRRTIQYKRNKVTGPILSLSKITRTRKAFRKTCNETWKV